MAGENFFVSVDFRVTVVSSATRHETIWGGKYPRYSIVGERSFKCQSSRAATYFLHEAGYSIKSAKIEKGTRLAVFEPTGLDRGTIHRGVVESVKIIEDWTRPTRDVSGYSDFHAEVTIVQGSGEKYAFKIFAYIPDISGWTLVGLSALE